MDLGVSAKRKLLLVMELGRRHPELWVPASVAHASPAQGVQEGSASAEKGRQSGLLGVVVGCSVGMDKRGFLLVKARHRGAGEARSLTRAPGDAGGGPSCPISN